MHKYKLLLMAATTVFALSACDHELTDMHWQIDTSPAKNFDTEASPTNYPTLMIVTNYKAGEATITCTNYKDVYIDKDDSHTEYTNTRCGFTITKTAGNTFNIKFKEIDDTATESDYLTLRAKNGSKTVASSLGINRHTPD